MSYVFHGGENKRGRNRISIDIVVILIIVVFFCIRCIVVLNNYRERGAYAYVQLLNYCMPVVEELNYDASDYAENNLSIKNVILQSLGLYNLRFEDIVSNELTVFAQINRTITGAVANNNSGIQPYEINSNSIAMITEEENEAIAKESPAYDESLKKTLDEANPEGAFCVYNVYSILYSLKMQGCTFSLLYKIDVLSFCIQCLYICSKPI